MKVFSNGEWYYPLPPAITREEEFEKFLVQESDALFPGFEVAPFKKKLQDNQTRRSEPDLVMVDKRFSEWYIIEVERSDHSLDDHVIPQCEVFADAQIGLETAKQISDAFSVADRPQVKELVGSIPPKVSVIVDSPCPDWVSPLRRLGVQLGVVERFRNHLGQVIYTCSGELPQTDDVLSRLRVPKALSFQRMLEVENPAAVREGPIEIRSRFGVETWLVRNYRGKFLKPPTTRDLKESVLIMNEDHQYEIREFRGKL